jgi:hypothetical protein
MKEWLQRTVYYDAVIPKFEEEESTYKMLEIFREEYKRLEDWIRRDQPRLLEGLQAAFSIQPEMAVSILDQLYQRLVCTDSASMHENYLFLIEVVEIFKHSDISRSNITRLTWHLKQENRRLKVEYFQLKTSFAELKDIYTELKSFLKHLKSREAQSDDMKALIQVLTQSDRFVASMEILKLKKDDYSERIAYLKKREEDCLESVGLILRSRKDGRIIQRKEEEIKRLSLQHYLQQSHSYENLLENVQIQKYYVDQLVDFPKVL